MKIISKAIKDAITNHSVAIKGTATKCISAQKLNHIKQQYKPSDFKPTFKNINLWGKAKWKAPKVSRRKLADMRKNCEYLGIDPNSIGLPPKPEKKPPRNKPRKGAKHERNAPERKAKIAKALEEMPQTIAAWRLVCV
ncbi:8064_t:CDS:2 [Cetraspora pellucida]|uniref:8064_t:CDS:1 n=1 Tax=Cetraspora pellucida TaxID=1433469 RepID=A0A9N9HMH2_9GLOM|nr:8064_t:CDS:2 [Cetraspora pellucida]